VYHIRTPQVIVISIRFIGKNTSVGNGTVLGNNVKIYGSTRIGSNGFIDNNVVIGYITQDKLLKIIRSGYAGLLDEIIDDISSGASIGNNVIIRSGTTIYEDTSIEDDVIFGHNVLIRERTVIRSRCKIGTGTVIDGNVDVGMNTIIQTYVYIPPKVRIGSNVFIAPRVVFTNDRYPPSRRIIETIIEDGVVIGANTIVTPGIVIGKEAVIAAGSVVTKSVEPYTVVAGIPAKPIMSRDEYEEKKKKYELNHIFPYR